MPELGSKPGLGEVAVTVKVYASLFEDKVPVKGISSVSADH